MWDFKNIILFFILCLGCTFSNSEQVRTVAEGAFEHVSMSSSTALELSREAAVEIVARNQDGIRVRGTGAYIKYKQHHFILTAGHVVAGSDVVRVSSGREVVIAEVVYMDIVSDIAVLRIEGLFTRKPLKWRPTGVEIGTEVLYTGFPSGYKNMTVKGYVSSFSGGNIILHSYAWSGASGSVVLDNKGRIVGVLTAVGIGYAFDYVPQIVEDVVLVTPIQNLKEEDLTLFLSN